LLGHSAKADCSEVSTVCWHIPTLSVPGWRWGQTRVNQQCWEGSVRGAVGGITLRVGQRSSKHLPFAGHWAERVCQRARRGGLSAAARRLGSQRHGSDIAVHLEVHRCQRRLFEGIDRDTEEAEGKQVDYWGMFSR
jgi:hypothetical protein